MSGWTQRLSSQRDGLVRVGIVSWSVIGVVLVLTVVLGLLAAVSEIVLPLVFAVLLGAAAYPLARRLQRLGLQPAIALLVVVVAMIVTAVGVVLLTVRAIIQEAGQLTHAPNRCCATHLPATLQPT